MKQSLVKKSLLWGLIVLVQIHGHEGCFEEEMMDPLEIKEIVKSNTNYADHLLPSWVDDHQSECCEWELLVFRPLKTQLD